MMTPAEENATLIFAVIPSVETPYSFLNDKSILDDQNLCIESHSFQTQYDEIPSPVEAIEISSETSEAPSVEEPEKEEIKQRLLVSTDQLQLEVKQLYTNPKRMTFCVFRQQSSALTLTRRDQGQ